MPATSPLTQEMLSSYEGQNVSAIHIIGRPDLNPQQYASAMAQKVGKPFSKAKVEATAAALKKAGHFPEVRIRTEPTAKGVEVQFVLEPGDYFGIFSFPGAQRFPYAELVQRANYPPQNPFSSYEIEGDRKSLETFFQREGYFNAQVQAHVHLNPADSIANIEFATQLRKQSKFGSAVVHGAPKNRDAQLANKLTGIMARLHGAGIRPGKAYHHTTVVRARRYLQKQVIEKGYLGAKVNVDGAQYDAQTNRANIYFTVHPGVLTHVQVNGAHLWSWDKTDLLPVYQGIGVDQEAVQEGTQALISYFQKKGYFDVKVNAKLDTSPSDNTVIYNITKEKKHEVTAIHITGNTHLPDSKLMPSVALQKKHLFSPGDYSNQLVQSSIKNLTGIYNSEGFSKAKVTAAVHRAGDDIQVTFQVVEGPQNIVHAVAIEGAETFPEAQFAPNGLKVRQGQPYSAQHVEEDRSQIIANYLKAGYLNMSFRETATEVSSAEPHQINVVYHIDEGPRVTTGNIITLGRKRTARRILRSETTSLQPGKPLREQDMLTAGSKLYDLTGVFDWAEVDPKRPITTQTKEDVLVKVHEAKRNEFQYGFGFEVIERGGSIPSGTVALPNLPPIGLPQNFTTSQQTFYGPRGTAQYTRNNLRGKGESITATAFAGRLDQRGALYYIDPNFRWTHWKATSSVSVERDEENPIFSSQMESASMELQRPIDHAQKNIVFFRYRFSKTDLTRVLIPALVPTEDLHIHLSTFGANFTRDTRDNPLDEHRGMLGTLELDMNSTKLGSSVDFAKLTGQYAFYKEKIHHIVWADSIRIGLAQPLSSSFVPLSEAFFTGGSNTLRGFPLDGAGPQRSVQVCSNGASSACTFIRVPAGGNELLILNSEARIPLSGIKKGLGYVLFYDGGNVFPNVGFHDFTSLYSNSVGIGLRYATPVGPIRFDIGRNLNPISGISATQYFVTIGQAF
ncbi:MAG: POTRA domain-containing protein [Acidobacteriota bacterium]